MQLRTPRRREPGRESHRRLRSRRRSSICCQDPSRRHSVRKVFRALHADLVRCDRPCVVGDGLRRTRMWVGISLSFLWIASVMTLRREGLGAAALIGNEGAIWFYLRSLLEFRLPKRWMVGEVQRADCHDRMVKGRKCSTLVTRMSRGCITRHGKYTPNPKFGKAGVYMTNTPRPISY